MLVVCFIVNQHVEIIMVIIATIIMQKYFVELQTSAC